MAIPFEDSINRTTAQPRFVDEVFPDVATRDAFLSTLRYEGLTCYVQDVKKNFQLVGGITNNDWRAYGSGGGGTGALKFRSHPDNGAVIDFSNGYLTETATFANNGEKIVATLPVLEDFTDQKFLKISARNLGSSGNYALNCTVMRTGIVLVHTHTLDNIPVGSIDNLTFELTDASGSGVTAGDLLNVIIERVAATNDNSSVNTIVFTETGVPT